MSGEEGSERVLAVDANNLIHRAWHGFHRSGQPERRLSTAGVPTEAVHGMISIMTRRCRQIGASHLIVAFDPPGGCPTRKALVPGYKSGREESPGELRGQLELAHRLLQESGLAVVRPDGWEADDVLASVAATADGSRRVWLLTADRDVLQTLRPEVRILLPDGGVELDEAAAEMRYGVPARSYPHLAAIRGEPGDGIPGVAGVGKVGAERLIRAFGSVEKVLQASEAELIAVAGRRCANAILRDGQAARTALAAGRLRDDLPIGRPSALAELDELQVRTVLGRAGLQESAERIISLRRPR